LFHERFVHDKLVIPDVIDVISVSRLIQSHRKGRAASAAFVKKNPDGLNLPVLEIFTDLLLGRGGDFDVAHYDLLRLNFVNRKNVPVFLLKWQQTLTILTAGFIPGGHYDRTSRIFITVRTNRRLVN